MSWVERDSLGSYARFNAPTIANGKVYFATCAGTVMAHGLS